MIKWLKSQNSILLQLAVVFLFSFPLLGLRIPVISIVLLGGVSIFFHKNLGKNLSYALPLLLLFPLLYLYQYFADPSPTSWIIFEKKIAFLVIPIFFANLSKNTIKKDLPLYVTVGVSSLLTLVGLSYLAFFGVMDKFTPGGTSFALRSTIEDVLHIHPTYLSLLLSFSVGIMVYLIVKSKVKKLAFVFLGLMLFHVAFILMLASRMALIGLLVVLIFTGLTYRKELKSNIKYLVILFAFLGIASWSIPSSQERIKELITSVTSSPSPKTTSTNIRHSIYYCSLLLLEQNWVSGVGTGQLQQHLNSCYYFIESYALLDRNYNTHNEFLNVWLGLGIIGVIIFISILGFGFYYSNGNFIAMVFLILFSLFCITENLLERQFGVFFFTFWFSYFILYLPPNNAKNTPS